MTKCRNCGQPIVQAYDIMDGYYWTHPNSDTIECLNGQTKAEE